MIQKIIIALVIAGILLAIIKVLLNMLHGWFSIQIDKIEIEKRKEDDWHR